MVVGAVLTISPARAGTATPATPDATIGPLVSGESAYVDGTYTWTDYAYDDTGAQYPAELERGNAADLIQLQLRLVPKGVEVRAVLQTLLSAGVPRLTVTLDGERHELNAESADVDVETNTITAALPLARRGGTLRASAALGIAGSDAEYDLAFVRGEEPTTGGNMLASASVAAVTGMGHATGGQWQDKRQAEMIAAGTPAFATIDLDAMRARRTTLPDVGRPGYHTWLYHSDADLGEGIVDGTAAGGLWAGPYQPYLVQVPDRAPTPMPVVLYLHGGGGNHLDNGMFAPQGELDPGDNLLVFPFGRETTTAQDHGYEAEGERDVLDVLDDVARNYRVDPRRILASGTSTGGGGAFRMAQLHPDKFAAVLVLSAYDDTHLPENLINLPVWLHNGVADPAANQAVLAGTQRELDALGTVDYRSWSALAHSHAEPVAALTNCLLERFTDHPAVVDPPRVVYSVDPRNENEFVRHRGAYWLSGLGLRRGVQPSGPDRNTGAPGYGDAAAARIDVTALTRPVRTTVATPVEAINTGGDYCGNAADNGEVWREHGVALSPGRRQRTANGIAIDTRNFAAAEVDLARIGVDASKPVVVRATTDGKLALTLRHGDTVRSVRIRQSGTHTIRLG